MKKFIYIGLMVQLLLLGGACTSSGQQKDEKGNQIIANGSVQKVNRTEAEWKKILTPQQYQVLREKGTDRAFTGKYYLHKEKGVYSCAACGYELFTSDMKFESECGWPSFDEEMAGDRIKKVVDTSHGMIRTEIVCARCDSHLGHLFDDGPTLTGKRYCVNSTSIDFAKQEEKK